MGGGTALTRPVQTEIHVHVLQMQVQTVQCCPSTVRCLCSELTAGTGGAQLLDGKSLRRAEKICR